MKKIVPFFTVLLIILLTLTIVSEASNGCYNVITQEKAEEIVDYIVKGPFKKEMKKYSFKVFLITEEDNNQGTWATLGINCVEKQIMMLGLGTMKNDPSCYAVIFNLNWCTLMSDDALMGLVAHDFGHIHDWNTGFCTEYLDFASLTGYMAREKMNDCFILTKEALIVPLYEMSKWIMTYFPPVNDVPIWSGLLPEDIRKFFFRNVDLYIIAQEEPLTDNQQAIYDYFTEEEAKQ